MNDLARAKDILKAEHCTCVLCRMDMVYLRRERGISPMLDMIGEHTDLRGFSAADTIVGKAAALLFVYAGVIAMHANVMSKTAAMVLEEHHIHYTYDTMTEYIINRRGDGMCPMEETVRTISDPAEAYPALLQKREQLRKE